MKKAVEWEDEEEYYKKVYKFFLHTGTVSLLIKWLRAVFPLHRDNLVHPQTLGDVMEGIGSRMTENNFDITELSDVTQTHEHRRKKWWYELWNARQEKGK